MPFPLGGLVPARLRRDQPDPASGAPEPGSPLTEAALVRRHAVLGLVASTILAVGAIGVGYLPPRSRLNTLPVAEWMRTTEGGRVFANLAVIVGTLLLLRAWLLIWTDVRHERITSHRRLVRTFWVWALPLVVAPPLFSQDLYSYTAQGNLLRVGYDPYSVGPSAVPTPYLEPVSTTWLDTPAPYGPGFLWIGSLTSDICGNHVYLAALVMRLVALVGVALISVYLPRLAAACGVRASLAVWAGLLNPLVLMHFVSGAHNDALMVGLVVAALALAVEGRPVVAAVLVALAASVKAPAFLVLGFVGLAWAARRDGTTASRLRSRIRAWVLVSVVGGATFAAINWAAGLNLGWIDALRTPGLVKTWFSPVTAVGRGLGELGQAVGLGDHTDTTLELARGISLFVLFALVVWWLLRPRGIDPVEGAGLALLMFGVFGPVVQSWYLLWGLVVLAAVRTGKRGIALYVLTTTVLVVNNLIQTPATADPLIRWSDGFVALVTYVFAAVLLVTWRRVGGDIRGGREEWLRDWRERRTDHRTADHTNNLAPVPDPGPAPGPDAARSLEPS